MKNLKLLEILGVIYIDGLAVFGVKDDYTALQLFKFEGKEMKVLYNSVDDHYEFSRVDLNENPKLRKIVELLEVKPSRLGMWDVFRLITVLRTISPEILKTRAFADMPEATLIRHQEILGTDFNEFDQNGKLVEMEFSKFSVRLIEMVRKVYLEENKNDPFNNISDQEINDIFNQFYWNNWNSSGVYS